MKNKDFIEIKSDHEYSGRVLRYYRRLGFEIASQSSNDDEKQNFENVMRIFIVDKKKLKLFVSFILEDLGVPKKMIKKVLKG